MKNALLLVLTCLLFVVGWEGVSQFNQQYLFTLPSPSQVFLTLSKNFPRFVWHSWITIQEMVVGFSLAFVVAFPLAWVMNKKRAISCLLQPFFILVQCIPMFTLAPLMIIWFGWTFTAIVVPTALMIFFPLTLNIYQGLQSTPPYLLEYFRVHQATNWQTFTKLQFPWALPHIFCGIKLAAVIAGIAAVAGEWAGGQSGLGILMLESRRDIDLETNFAALFCLICISLSLYCLIVAIEYLITHRVKLKRQFKAQLQHPFIAKLGSLLGCLLLLGCRSTDQHPSAIRLTLDWFPNPNHIPLYVGLEKGFFTDQGINLVLQKLHDPGYSTPYLNSGQCEIALSYMPHVIQMNKKNASLVPIGILIDRPLQTIIYRENSGIKTIADLNGKKMGFCSGSKESAFLNAILKEGYITPLEKLNIGFDLVFSLGTKRVDALYGGFWNIEIEQLLNLGIAVNYFTLQEFGVPPYYELIFLAKEGTAQAQPHFQHSFKQALQQSIDYAINNPEEAFALYMRSQPDKSLKTQEWERKAWGKTIPALARSQELSPYMWAHFEEWLEQHYLSR